MLLYNGSCQHAHINYDGQCEQRRQRTSIEVEVVAQARGDREIVGHVHIKRPKLLRKCRQASKAEHDLNSDLKLYWT